MIDENCRHKLCCALSHVILASAGQAPTADALKTTSIVSECMSNCRGSDNDKNARAIKTQSQIYKLMQLKQNPHVPLRAVRRAWFVRAHELVEVIVRLSA